MKEKGRKQKIICISIMLISMMCVSLNVDAHSGRTDANGGHKDNKNASGLGSYHYHCGGNPAHLHPNGVCPYSSKSKSNTSTKKENTTTKSKSNTKTDTSKTTSKPTTIEVTAIEIKKETTTLIEGETKILTCSVLPDNATDKKIVWKSTNEQIISVDEQGRIVAKKVGTASIIASSINGKTDTISITVIAKETEDKEIGNSVQAVSSNISNTNTIDGEKKEQSNILGGVAAVGILGGGCYWGYRKNRGSKLDK